MKIVIDETLFSVFNRLLASQNAKVRLIQAAMDLPREESEEFIREVLENVIKVNEEIMQTNMLIINKEEA